MSRPGTSREALILETLDEVAKLLDRVDRLTMTMEAGREALRQAAVVLGVRVKSFEAEVSSRTRQAERVALEHIVQRTNEMTGRVLKEQSQAMRDAAGQAFAEHLQPAVTRLEARVRHLVQRLERPWANWMTHVATAAGSATLTLIVVVVVSK